MRIDCIDEATGMAPTIAVSLSLAGPEITARSLIRARVEIEAERMAAPNPEAARWLVRPAGRGDPMIVSNPDCPPAPGTSDVEARVAVALAGFEAGSFFLFVADRQVLSLDEVLPLGVTNEVVFLQLVPLKGG